MEKILTTCSGGSEIAVLVRTFLITFLFIFPLNLKAEGSISAEAINAESIAMPEISEDMLKQSKEILNSVQKIQASPEYKTHQNWINQNSQKLFARQGEQLPTIDYGISKDQLEKDAIAKLLNNYRFKADDVQKAQITHFPLMIFVSSSIPQSSLKDLMIQAKKSGGVLVFRGMIGSLKSTAKFLGDISKNNVQAIIDPRLFDLFNVQVVPTIIVLKTATQNCQSDGNGDNNGNSCKITPIHDRISGNITLDYALETIVNGQGETSQIASKFLAKIMAGGQDGKL